MSENVNFISEGNYRVTQKIFPLFEKSLQQIYFRCYHEDLTFISYKIEVVFVVFW